MSDRCFEPHHEGGGQHRVDMRLRHEVRGEHGTDLHERDERGQHERKVEVDGADAHSISGVAIGLAVASLGNLLMRVETSAEEGQQDIHLC